MSETTDGQTTEEFERATSAELNDADIDRDRAIVGRDWASRSQEFLSTATPEAIRNFATGYGDDNPLFTDPDYGRATRWGGQIAPPIMAAVLNAPLRGERPSKRERGGSYRGIHAFVSGGTWDWYRPIRPGDTLYAFGGLETVEVKRSEFAGRSVVKVHRQVKMNQNAEVVGVYRTLVIFTERRRARERGKYSGIEDPGYTDEVLGAPLPDRLGGRRRVDGLPARRDPQVQLPGRHPGEVTGKTVAGDGRCLADIAFKATNQRGEDTMKGTATIALPSREHGPALLPAVPAGLQRKAIEMLARHGELLREGQR